MCTIWPKIFPGHLFFLFILLISCNNNDPPNIILIMADDMGAECLSAYGGTSYSTPNLDRMAREGIVVSHCIAQPLCTPSRVKLMTGLSNERNYTHFGRLDTAWLNMGTLMKEAGYSTCISGKWQLNGLAYREKFPDWNDPNRPHWMGFEEHCLWQLTHGRSEGERFANPLIEQNGKVLETGPDDYGPDIFCDYILDFIDRNHEDPFFIYYPMVLVHEPFVPTPDSKEWADPAARYEWDTGYFRDMMIYTDKLVGKIRDHLEGHGIRQNTILIFTGDNGTDRHITSQTRERTVRGAKGMTISDGVRVPLLIEWPEQIKQGSVYGGLIEFSDFFPTLAALTERKVRSDGKSFLPLLKGEKYDRREYVRVHYDPRWGNWVNQFTNTFVQTREFKLYRDGSFYDLRNDIMESYPMTRDQLTPPAREIYDMLEKSLELDEF